MVSNLAPLISSCGLVGGRRKLGDILGFAFAWHRIERQGAIRRSDVTGAVGFERADGVALTDCR